MCDALTNTCAANQAAKDLCVRAQDAANTAVSPTGAQADGSCLQFVNFICLIVASFQRRLWSDDQLHVCDTY